MAPTRDSAAIQAKILRRAQTLKGGAQALADYLGVEPAQLEPWCSGAERPPAEIFEKALDVVVAWKLSQRGS